MTDPKNIDTKPNTTNASTKGGKNGRRTAPSDRAERLANELRGIWPDLTREERLFIAQRAGLWLVPYLGFPPPELLPVTGKTGAIAGALQTIMSRRSNLNAATFALLTRETIEQRVTQPVVEILDAYLTDLTRILKGKSPKPAETSTTSAQAPDGETSDPTESANPAELADSADPATAE